jgi:hypothetical protein
MPRARSIPTSKNRVARRSPNTVRSPGASRYSVGLPSALAVQVENYANLSDLSFSKAIVALVRLGLESQEARKREFFAKLRKNLMNDDPKTEDQMVDEFRAMILGR